MPDAIWAFDRIREQYRHVGAQVQSVIAVNRFFKRNPGIPKIYLELVSRFGWSKHRLGVTNIHHEEQGKNKYRRKVIFHKKNNQSKRINRQLHVPI